MSEKHTHSYDQLITPENDQERQEQLAIIEARLHASPNKQADDLDQLRSTIDQQAPTSEDIAKPHLHDQDNQHRSHHYITKKIKATQYKQTIKEVQANLTPTQKRFSTIIHQPAIERVSEVGAKTIARPTGIVSGALFALIGSLIIMYIARHIGFEIPTTIFGLLFIVGFVFGIIAEFVLHLFKRSKSHDQITPNY